MTPKPCLRIVGLAPTERSLLACVLRGHGFEVVDSEGPESLGIPTVEPRDVLTRRQLEVLRALRCHGSREIAARSLGIALKTVDAHLEHIYARTGVRTRTQALCWACRRGLIDEGSVQDAADAGAISSPDPLS